MFDKKDYMKKWQLKHRDRYKEYNRKYVKAHPDRIKEQTKRYTIVKWNRILDEIPEYVYKKEKEILRQKELEDDEYIRCVLHTDKSMEDENDD